MKVYVIEYKSGRGGEMSYSWCMNLYDNNFKKIAIEQGTSFDSIKDFEKWANGATTGMTRNSLIRFI